MTDRSSRRTKIGGIMAAALALPGVLPSVTHAETAPEKSTIGFKYLDYQDSQAGLDRIKVRSPALYLQTPVGERYLVDASLVTDSVSGASPRCHSGDYAICKASKMSDNRTAGDVKVTRYFARSAVALGVTYSNEHDYRSKAFSLNGRFSSEDNNSTISVGLGLSNDEINATNGGSTGDIVNKKKNSHELMVGLTQVVTPRDVVQTMLTYTSGKGYFTDPYKFSDRRPDSRDQTAWLVRWNHYLPDWNATFKPAFRYYKDSYGVGAMTVSAEWDQPFGNGWIAIPSLRYYSQRAASFYRDPQITFASVNDMPYFSGDQRLSAFGAVTVGLKMVKQFANDWTVDVKAEQYEQRANWRFSGEGSPGLLTFKARFYQFGVSKRF